MLMPDTSSVPFLWVFIFCSTSIFYIMRIPKGPKGVPQGLEGVPGAVGGGYLWASGGHVGP